MDPLKLLCINKSLIIFNNCNASTLNTNLTHIGLAYLLAYSLVVSGKRLPLYLSYHQTLTYKSDISEVTEKWSLSHSFLSDGSILRLYTISDKLSLISLESLWRIFAWQEREVKEFTGLSFLNKRDNRSLFLFFLVGGSPIAKSFPVIGLWCIKLDLTWTRSHISIKWIYWFLF